MNLTIISTIYYGCEKDGSMLYISIIIIIITVVIILSMMKQYTLKSIDVRQTSK